MSEHPLEPPLPFDLRRRARTATRDLHLRQLVRHAASVKDAARLDAFGSSFGAKYDALRQHAGDIRQHVLDHLDVYLDRFVENATAAGTTVHFAATAEEARAICLDIARRADCRVCVKSKSMVTEEIRLVPALEAAGIETVETDLGEFVVQLDDDAPSHIVMPIIHKGRRDVADSFQRHLGVETSDDPVALTRIAREYLRRKYLAADLGISGANFLVAETGSVVVCTNEGNADLALNVPRVHVAITGMEKVLPAVEHLAVMLKMLARSATGQPITVYTSFVNGPRRSDEVDGPDEVHVILIDAGRSGLLAPASRESLRCIRCGACLNTCPVFRSLGGGHAYGAVYSGPIGSVITPALASLTDYPDLPRASSLCGACHEVCPVNIDLPGQLLRLRQELADRRVPGGVPHGLLRMWAACLRRPWAHRMAMRGEACVLSIARTRWGRGLCRGIKPLAAWTAHRELPRRQDQSFRAWWRDRSGVKP